MLGIEKEYKIIKKVRRKLLLNDKLIDYLYERLKQGNYVYMTGYDTYEEITKDLLKELLSKAEEDERHWNRETFAVVADYPEYEECPFEVSHASPYDHRWEGDYDEDAYDDWKVDAVSLSDLLYEDTWQREPVYATHPELFDFADEETIVEKEKLEGTDYWW